MLTDFSAHQALPLQALPPVGNIYHDPVFGTDMMVAWTGKVTDPIRCLQGAAWKYGAFTFDSSAMSAAGYMFPIDPTTLKLGPAFPLPANAGGSIISPSRSVVYFFQPYWGNVLYEWDYTSSAAPVKLYDFTGHLPTPATQSQWNIEGIAQDDSRILVKNNVTPVRILVFDRIKGKPIWQRDPVNPQQDYLKPWLCKAGKYCGPFEDNLLLAPVADVDTGIETVWTGLGPDSIAQHAAQLSGALAHFGGLPGINAGQIMLSDFTQGPQKQLPLVPDNFMPGPAGYIDGHCNDESWVLTSSLAYLGTGPSASLTLAPGQGEVFMFRQDGATRQQAAGSIRRYCHVRSSWANNDDYWNRAHACISPRGDLIAFSTNWENPNPVAPAQLWMLLIRTGLGPFTKQVTRPSPVIPAIDIRTPWLGVDRWAGAGQTRGPIGAGQYNGSIVGTDWVTESGLKATFAITPPCTIVPGSGGKYTIPADAPDNALYRRSVRIGQYMSAPSDGLIICGTRDPGSVLASQQPDFVAPPDNGERFADPAVPPQTVLNPTPVAATTQPTTLPPVTTTPPPITTPPTPPPATTTPAAATLLVTLTPLTAQLTVGQTLKFSATQALPPGSTAAMPSNVPAIVWSVRSLSGTVGTIDQAGLFTALAVGSAEVTAKGLNSYAIGIVFVQAAATTHPPPPPPAPVSQTPPPTTTQPVPAIVINDKNAAAAMTIGDLIKLFNS